MRLHVHVRTGAHREAIGTQLFDMNGGDMNKNNVLLFFLLLCVTAGITCSQVPDEADFGSTGCASGGDMSTGVYFITSQDVERVYYLKLPAGYDSTTPYPLIFAFHGAGGNYTAFTENTVYDLHAVVGEEAILVYPNAYSHTSDFPRWDYNEDLVFFDDLYNELALNLCFDTRKVFAVGHSDGAGFANALGCRRGDVLRAIAPVAGGLLEYSDCIGQVAVIQVQGANDVYVPPGMVKPGRDYWIAINSCSKETTTPGSYPACEEYGGCDTDFPVQYCEHDGGHEWPGFAGAAIKNFFSRLPDAEPSRQGGTGNADGYAQGEISFKIQYPADFVGTPYKLALSLYPYDTTQPLYVAPSYILNPDVPLGEYRPGEISEYNNIAINLLGVDYGDYALSVVVYVDGSNYPIPTTGTDYTGLQNITLDDTVIVVEQPFELEFVDSF